ncbi:PadR family transcriptional regulator [Streptosporangiaceae bacterium NEAU-GS5]|nr:PadR family transcriptional regulator [Streptosporangiaceae bacterium NEAU-GS5]
MYSDIVILRGLLQGPRHGYDIKKYVERVTGGLLNNNTLYPALRKFEQRGEIRKVAEETAPGRPARTVYQITERGRNRFRALLEMADPLVLAKQEEFQVRVGHFDLMSPATRMRILEVRRDHLENALAVQEELASFSDRHPWGSRIVGFNGAQIRAELSWLDELAGPAKEAPNGSLDDNR